MMDKLMKIIPLLVLGAFLVQEIARTRQLVSGTVAQWCLVAGIAMVTAIWALVTVKTWNEGEE